MKVYEYLNEVLSCNEITFEEITAIDVVYLKCPNRFDHDTWEVVHKELKGTVDVPINPMHVEEWDDDIKDIFRVADSKREELVMNIVVELYNGSVFHTFRCINPMRTPMTLIN